MNVIPNEIMLNAIRLVPSHIPLLAIEQAEMLAAQNASRASRSININLNMVPTSVDYSPQIPFVRHQGGYGCGLNSLAACWDIMNELQFTNSPNMSVNRMIWACEYDIRSSGVQQIIAQLHADPTAIPDNVWLSAFNAKNYNSFRSIPSIPGSGIDYIFSYMVYLVQMGCPTEGTELTNSNGIKYATGKGNSEASRYKAEWMLDGLDIKFWHGVGLDVNTFRHHLSLLRHPLRLSVNLGNLPHNADNMSANHFVTLVGYDDASRRFKFLNSWGDNWQDARFDAHDGFGYIDYDKLDVADDAEAYRIVYGAEYFQVAPIVPTPTARIGFHHSVCRQDVSLFLYGKRPNGTDTVKQIWPSGQGEDNSRNLTFTVTLPPECVWPPTANNPLRLQVYDSGEHSFGGGDLVEFYTSNLDNKQVCNQLQNGPVHFEPHKLTTLSIP